MHIEKPLGVAGEGQQVGWGCWSQGSTRVGGTVLARLMKTETWLLLVSAGLVQGGLSKITMASARTSVWEKAILPVLAMQPYNSGPALHVPGTF